MTTGGRWAPDAAAECLQAVSSRDIWASSMAAPTGARSMVRLPRAAMCGI